MHVVWARLIRILRPLGQSGVGLGLGRFMVSRVFGDDDQQKTQTSSLTTGLQTHWARLQTPLERLKAPQSHPGIDRVAAISKHPLSTNAFPPQRLKEIPVGGWRSREEHVGAHSLDIFITKAQHMPFDFRGQWILEPTETAAAFLPRLYRCRAFPFPGRVQGMPWCRSGRPQSRAASPRPTALSPGSPR